MRATASARSRSAAITPPDNPNLELLAKRTASSSPSCGKIASTGPNTSSWAISLFSSAPMMIVGWKKKPVSWSVAATADDDRGAVGHGTVDHALHLVALAWR